MLGYTMVMPLTSFLKILALLGLSSAPVFGITCYETLGLLSSTVVRPKTFDEFLSEPPWERSNWKRVRELASKIILDGDTFIDPTDEFPFRVSIKTHKGNDTLFISLEQFYPRVIAGKTEVNIANARALIDGLEAIKYFASAHTTPHIRIFARVSTQPMATTLAKAGFQVADGDKVTPLTEKHLETLLVRGIRPESAPGTIGMVIELIR